MLYIKERQIEEQFDSRDHGCIEQLRGRVRTPPEKGARVFDGVRADRSLFVFNLI